MLEIILILIIIILIIYINGTNNSKSRAQFARQQYVYPSDGSFYSVGYDPTALYGTALSGQNGSIREVELDNTIRGVVPVSTQPNHTANMWKCDTSQSDDSTVKEIVCDHFRPMGNNVVNMDVGDSSRMHITSRFASTGS
jgi:hypothetical protein